MRKRLSVILAILLLWSSSCDHETPIVSQATSQSKITLTDVDHDPVAKDLLSKVRSGSANGRAGNVEITDAFFKYSDPDSGILNYTFRLPDDSPDYFENLVLSQYDDDFYGFIYRYIPETEYTGSEPFKGILQLYNLDNKLIREFSVPYIQDSVSAGGRVQLMNQCIRSIEQSCFTTYEIQTVTDYPCHCQYDRRVETGTVCTFTLNTGWCDDMIAAPPAGGGGTYIGPSDAAPRSGGPGGATKLPVKNPVVVVPDNDDIIYDKVKSPCLRMAIKNLVSKDLTNDINKAILDIFETKPNINLIFEEEAALGDRPGRTISDSRNGSFNVTILLNPTLENSSSEYIASVVYHEAMHAFLNANGFGYEFEQHIEMAENYIDWMVDALKEISPSLSDKDAICLSLRGFGTILERDPPYFNKLISRYGLDLEMLISITDKYRDNLIGTKCLL
ncbi:MAG TPA: hypothetical protein VIN08_01815 [Ohtaekwangia sp.]|uniref:hypothetical protein n=1 Tax=Ohtaekwangia sp. TaxID=2066019 RepID=UPI002F933546